MLSYRHAFHAGNFADVLKHWLQIQLITAMQRKPQPFLYLETHAGPGRYDLHSRFAQKLREYESGIGRLWGLSGLPSGLERYLQAVRQDNTGHRLRFYPGSPALALQLLRHEDRAVFCELHPAELKDLERLCHHRRRTQIEAMDGLKALKAFLPPKEARALVFLDPAYELDEEYRLLPKCLAMAQKRCVGGVFALWYPLLNTRQSQQLPERIARIAKTPLLRAELWVRQPGVDMSVGMYGCGVLVLNPPWQLDEQLAEGLPWLAETLGEGEGGFRLDWLVNE